MSLPAATPALFTQDQVATEGRLRDAQAHLDALGEERIYESALRAVVSSLVAELNGAKA